MKVGCGSQKKCDPLLPADPDSPLEGAAGEAFVVSFTHPMQIKDAYGDFWWWNLSKISGFSGKQVLQEPNDRSVSPSPTLSPPPLPTRVLNRTRIPSSPSRSGSHQRFTWSGCRPVLPWALPISGLSFSSHWPRKH